MVNLTYIILFLFSWNTLFFIIFFFKQNTATLEDDLLLDSELMDLYMYYTTIALGMSSPSLRAAAISVLVLLVPQDPVHGAFVCLFCWFVCLLFVVCCCSSFFPSTKILTSSFLPFLHTHLSFTHTPAQALNFLKVFKS